MTGRHDELVGHGDSNRSEIRFRLVRAANRRRGNVYEATDSLGKSFRLTKDSLETLKRQLNSELRGPPGQANEYEESCVGCGGPIMKTFASGGPGNVLSRIRIRCSPSSDGSIQGLLNCLRKMFTQMEPEVNSSQKVDPEAAQSPMARIFVTQKEQKETESADPSESRSDTMTETEPDTESDNRIPESTGGECPDSTAETSTLGTPVLVKEEKQRLRISVSSNNPDSGESQSSPDAQECQDCECRKCRDCGKELFYCDDCSSKRRNRDRASNNNNGRRRGRGYNRRCNRGRYNNWDNSRSISR
ncbi:MAG: hypothetical protein MHMPM18_004679, partial [Marteilia pararefringens]